MTKSYSNDLRQKVVEYLDEGNTLRQDVNLSF
jgi:hypothetical protein